MLYLLQVVQVYVSWRDSPVLMPQLQLVSFKRVTLSAQQTVSVAVNVSSSQLYVWDDDKGFLLVPGSAAFLARDSMLSALYAIANPSVCLSVCHTGGSVENG